MVKGKGGKGKNLVSDKKEQVHYAIKTSYECERCEIQCPRGVKYLNNFHKTGKGNGVPCILKGV